MIFMYIPDRYQNSSKLFRNRLFDHCLSYGGAIDFHVQNLLIHFNKALFQTGFSKGSNSISIKWKIKKKKNRKNITHIIIFCFLLFHYQVWIFASLVVHVKKVFCSFSQRKFHINYAQKLDHYASDRHPWHLAENYAQVFLSVQFDYSK